MQIKPVVLIKNFLRLHQVDYSLVISFDSTNGSLGPGTYEFHGSQSARAPLNDLIKVMDDQNDLASRFILSPVQIASTSEYIAI